MRLRQMYNSSWNLRVKDNVGNEVAGTNQENVFYK